MPILGPSSPVFTINTFVPSVLIKVENRVNDSSRAQEWLAQAIIEITTDQQLRNDLIELEEIGPLFDLTPQTQEYPESNFYNPQDINLATVDLLLWIDPPADSIRIKLEQSHYQETDKFQPTTPSLPVKWYRYGTALGFYPNPDKAYQTQARYLKQHPINWTTLADTPILLSQNWYEIIILSAAQKGFLELEEYDKANAIGVLLRGDPDDPKRGPGLLYGRKTHRERESWRSQQGLKPMIHGYSHWPRG